MENVNLNEMTVEELDKLVVAIREEKKARKAEAKAAEKEAKEKLKEANAETLRGLDENATVRFTLKGEETEGVLDKVTDKRFVVIVEGVKKAIMFDKFLGVAE